MKLKVNNNDNDIMFDKLLTPEKEDYLISNYINKYNDIFYDEYITEEYDLSKFSEISSIGNSILNWYDFNKNDKVLEIGAKLGNLTAMLCEKAGFVTSLEFSKKRGEAISKRLKKYDNLEVVIGNLTDINIKDEEYDYITMIGILEYAPIFFENSENSYLDMLNWAKSKLKKNGKILLAIDNTLGVQYLVGGKNELFQDIFDSVTYNENNYFTKKGIENLLKVCGFDKYKFFYPFPNYRITNVIFSDEYPMSENISKIRYNVIYKENSLVVIDELKLYKNLVENGLGKELANSYLIEVCKNSDITKSKFRIIFKKFKLFFTILYYILKI